MAVQVAPREQVDLLSPYFVDRQAWTDWTPTVTQGVSVTITIAYAKYLVVGALVIVQARLAITSAGTIANLISIGGIPAGVRPAGATGVYAVIGNADIFINASSTFYQGALLAALQTDWRIVAHNSIGYVGVAPAFALASGDFLGLEAVYQKAA